VSKLIVELPEEIHKGLKKKAKLHHRTIKQVVTDLVEDYLSREEEKRPTKETGLCGKWEDTRTAGEIVADIKSRNNWFKKERVTGA
jgi:plasmid stability protein